MKGIIDRFLVDTKHFIGNAPQSIVIQGSVITDQVYYHYYYFLPEKIQLNPFFKKERKRFRKYPMDQFDRRRSNST